MTTSIDTSCRTDYNMRALTEVVTRTFQRRRNITPLRVDVQSCLFEEGYVVSVVFPDRSATFHWKRGGEQEFMTELNAMIDENWPLQLVEAA